MSISSLRKTIHLTYNFAKDYGWLLIIAALLMLCIRQIMLKDQIDWLLLSGIVTFAVAIYLGLKVPMRWKITIRRLLNRGVLVANSKQLEDVNIRLNHVSKIWAIVCAILTSLLVLLSFFILFRLENNWLALLETIGAFLAGWLFGRMAAYGRLPVLLKQQNLSLKAEPEHIDQVCGWQPLGDFYLFQAVVAAIPAIFLTVWLFIFPVVKRYERWRGPYLAFLTLTIILAILAFLVPMTSCHQEMDRQKGILLTEADQLSQNIVELRQELSGDEVQRNHKDIEIRLNYLLERNKKIENMTTWPVRSRSFRSFTIRNILLVIPLLSDFSGHPLLIQIKDSPLLSVLEKFLALNIKS